MEIDEYSEFERFEYGRWIDEPLDECPVWYDLLPIDTIEQIIMHDRRRRFPVARGCKMERTGDRITLSTPHARVSIYATPYKLGGYVELKAEYPTEAVDGGRGEKHRTIHAAAFRVWDALVYLLPN